VIIFYHTLSLFASEKKTLAIFFGDDMGVKRTRYG
jgi:hypothetical protein